MRSGFFEGFVRGVYIVLRTVKAFKPVGLNAFKNITVKMEAF